MYNMRLPDGGPSGEGYNGRGSMSMLRDGDQSTLLPIDLSTTYTSWTDLWSTVRAIIDYESANQSAPYVEVHAPDYDRFLNPSDHQDHWATADVVRAASLTRSWNLTWHVDYDIEFRPVNLTQALHDMKEPVFVAQDNVMGEANYGYSQWQDTYLAWLWRDYSRRVTAAPTNMPATPTSLAATPVSTTQIDLTWIDNATNETGYTVEQALDKIRTANAQGLTITTCVYPYSFWATYLSNNRFGPGWQERYGLSYEDLRIVGSSERLTARTFAHYRKSSKLAAVPEGTMPLDKTVNLALKEDFCMIGSDGGIQFEPRANSHPRGAGCFATAIRHALDIGLPLEKILEKMTSLPRSVVQPALKDRGVLEDGAVADLTVFDPQTIRGNATIENPNQFSSGIDLVIVNGKIAFKDGNVVAKNGNAILGHGL